MKARTVAGRVAWVAGATTAASGLVVALVTGGIVVALVDAQDDVRLRDAAGTLALELSDPGADAQFIAADETRELAHTGMRVAIYDEHGFLSGDRAVARVGAGDCADRGALRACAVADTAGRVGVVALRRDSKNAILSLFAGAAAIAVMLTAILGALTARALARWGIAPLARLSDAVARVPLDAPENADLGTELGFVELDALRSSLRSALGRLGAELGRSRRFSSDAAHELRTPLTTILGELDLARERVEDEEAARSLERARATALRLSALVERLLVLATPAARLEHAERVPLRDVIEDICAELPRAMRARVSLSLTDADLDGDATLLRAMVANGLENALKFSAHAVSVTLDHTAEDVLIAVDDDGPGVPLEERDQVFLPFYRTRASRAGGPRGHGVGLALIAHVAQLHGGRARFVDRARGARLELVLPRR